MAHHDGRLETVGSESKSDEITIQRKFKTKILTLGNHQAATVKGERVSEVHFPKLPKQRIPLSWLNPQFIAQQMLSRIIEDVLKT